LDDTIKRLLLEKRDGLAIPPFTLFETLRGLYAAKATIQIQNFNTLCEQCVMGEIRREDWIAGAKLLVTHNTRHVVHSAGLSLADWSAP
jgi:crotonobetainyl-CoA:carnitine CoA-transferase CaiB-like acyl-CoA transferase